MAKKSAAAPRFYEVVFRGKPKVVKAFLKGLAMGTGMEVTAFYSWDEGIHHEGRVEKFKELVGIRATDCRLVVDADAAAYLKKMARRIAEETGLEITGNRLIRSASMEFEYHAYARKYADQIREVFADLPDGLRLRDHEQNERRDPDAKGVEAYSATHDYEFNGRGRVTGRIDRLVEFRRRLAEYPLIKADEIMLNRS
jgi:hypothetical protein